MLWDGLIGQLTSLRLAVLCFAFHRLAASLPRWLEQIIRTHEAGVNARASTAVAMLASYWQHGLCLAADGGTGV